MKQLVAKIVHVIHLLIIPFAMTGWIFLDGLHLKYFAAFMILILVQWMMYQNQCVLTVFEDYLLGRARPEVKEAEDLFVGRIIIAATGKNLTVKAINRISYSIHSMSILATLVKILTEAQ
jgi:hypothetical protein